MINKKSLMLSELLLSLFTDNWNESQSAIGADKKSSTNASVSVWFSH